MATLLKEEVPAKTEPDTFDLAKDLVRFWLRIRLGLSRFSWLGWRRVVANGNGCANSDK
jgi:hypothetical protein